MNAYYRPYTAQVYPSTNNVAFNFHSGTFFIWMSLYFSLVYSFYYLF